ncbi:DUF6318 family protein [Micrococcus cohnii]|nr:DUF6318 family protein [Micrococcus cohnii]
MTVVLAGCGAGGDEQPARADSSGASATQTAEAKSVGGSSEDESSTPPSSETSSDDGGDYQPATKDGPAKNVPKPTMPDEMKKNTPEGAEAAVQYWWDTVYYLDETGNSDLMLDASHEDCSYCNRYATVMEEWYSSEKGWREGSRVTVGDSFTSEFEGGTQVGSKIYISEANAWDAEGKPRNDMSDVAYSDESWSFGLVFDSEDHHWKMWVVNREQP